MGYTHYFERKSELNAKDFSCYVGLIKKLVDTPEAKTILAEEYDEASKPALVTLDLIKFNGKDDEGHETFYFPRVMKEYGGQHSEHGLVFEFCKTARKPYDSYVVAALILAKGIFGNSIKFSSDGELEEMEDGRVLAESVLGKKIGLSKSGDSFVVKADFASVNEVKKNCKEYVRHE